jgi:hypothetical protein
MWFDPRTLLGLTVASLAFGVGAGGLYAITVRGLNQIFDPVISELLIAVLFSAGIVGGSTLYMYWWRKRTLGMKVVGLEEVRRTPSKRALVAFVSAGRRPTPAQSAIQFQLDAGTKLSHCWLLYSDDSLSNAENIAEEWIASIERDRRPSCTLIEVEDENDPRQVFLRVRQAIKAANKLGIAADDILIDLTGGTKLATFAMAFSAQDGSALAQYIFTPWDATHQRPDFNQSRPILLDYVLDTDIAVDPLPPATAAP